MAQNKTSDSRKLLKLRKRSKNKKPEFLRSESWRYSKMSESWRRPRGLDHKMRRKIKGWPPMVSTGYKGPKVARGLHPSGLREVMIHNVSDLALVDPSVQGGRIAHTIGKRKRALILAAAKEKKLRILNPGVAEEGEETGEVTAENEETTVEAETEVKAEKPRRSLLGRRKPAEETAPAAQEPLVEEKTIEKPNRKRKGAKSAKAEEEPEEEAEKHD